MSWPHPRVDDVRVDPLLTAVVVGTWRLPPDDVCVTREHRGHADRITVRMFREASVEVTAEEREAAENQLALDLAAVRAAAVQCWGEPPRAGLGEAVAAPAFVLISGDGWTRPGPPADPARSIAKLLAKFDAEDRQTFNWLIHEARRS
jgi:hypothetical protein